MKEDNTYLTGERLGDLRAELKLSRVAIRTETGINDTTIRDYEENGKQPTAPMIKKLAKFYGVTCDFLCGLEDERTHANTDISAVTGLSTESIRKLSFIKNADAEKNALNTLISSSSFITVLTCIDLLTNPEIESRQHIELVSSEGESQTLDKSMTLNLYETMLSNSIHGIVEEIIKRQQDGAIKRETVKTKKAAPKDGKEGK